MLQGTHGKQVKEVAKLVEYLRDENPDVVLFTNALLSGVIPAGTSATYSNIVITVTNSAGQSAALPAFSIKVSAGTSTQKAALGDTVLFHVRAGRLLTQFPPLRSADFGMAPEGISTQRDRLGEVSAQMLFQQGPLAAGDTLFAATDAFAKWIIKGTERRDKALWPLLGSLTHHAVFTRLVAEQRKAGALEDDDVTLMRIRDRWPPVALMVMSGKQHPEENDLPTGTVFLLKPFDFKELQSLLSGFASRFDDVA